MNSFLIEGINCMLCKIDGKGSNEFDECKQNCISISMHIQSLMINVKVNFVAVGSKSKIHDMC